MFRVTKRGIELGARLPGPLGDHACMDHLDRSGDRVVAAFWDGRRSKRRSDIGSVLVDHRAESSNRVLGVDGRHDDNLVRIDELPAELEPHAHLESFGLVRGVVRISWPSSVTSGAVSSHFENRLRLGGCCSRGMRIWWYPAKISIGARAIRPGYDLFGLSVHDNNNNAQQGTSAHARCMRGP